MKNILNKIANVIVVILYLKKKEENTICNKMKKQNDLLIDT